MFHARGGPRRESGERPRRRLLLCSIARAHVRQHEGRLRVKGGVVISGVAEATPRSTVEGRGGTSEYRWVGLPAADGRAHG
eukprot:3007233-Pleurochrysis_carterae.AAC.1